MRTLLILAGCTLALTVLYFNLPSKQQTENSNHPDEQIDETPYLTWVETGIAAYKARDSAGLNEAREQLSKHPEIAAEVASERCDRFRSSRRMENRASWSHRWLRYESPALRVDRL